MSHIVIGLTWTGIRIARAWFEPFFLPNPNLNLGAYP
jgi:hypothetical protein